MQKKEVRDSFKFLGIDFQNKLIAQLLTDRSFAVKMMDLLEINFFEDTIRRTVVKLFLDTWEEGNETVLDIASALIRIKAKITEPIKLKQIVDFIESEIPEYVSTNDTDYIQNYALNFCKQQKLKVTIKEIDDIINTGDADRYVECEALLKKALELGQGGDDTLDVCSDPDSVLADDFRKPIPTGIPGFDEYMDGGLGKGELGLILASYGAGKTTAITKMANHAKDMGYNVLQIFFEDRPKVIQRKHYTCWYNQENSERVTINDLSNHKEEVKELVKRKRTTGGLLKLKKFSSDATTIPKIRQYIRKLASQGFKVDIVFLDYIDCVQPAKHHDDQNVGEGNVMRAFESMLTELDIAGWSALQGNRLSINAEVVDGQQMGGSIKRGQIAHFVVSIAKTLDQQEDGMATLAILKSRFSKSGIILRDVIFDNERVIIDVSNAKGQTFVEDKQSKLDKNQIAVNSALEARRAVLGKKRKEHDDEEIQIGGN